MRQFSLFAAAGKVFFAAASAARQPLCRLRAMGKNAAGAKSRLAHQPKLSYTGFANFDQGVRAAGILQHKGAGAFGFLNVWGVSEWRILTVLTAAGN